MENANLVYCLHFMEHRFVSLRLGGGWSIHWPLLVGGWSGGGLIYNPTKLSSNLASLSVMAGK
jgi:hypothetical protein